MFITFVDIDGYKNLKEVFFEPHKKYNLITGKNAQGKTNLLEAIWIMTGCRSFRGSKDRDYIALDRKFMNARIDFAGGRRLQKIDYILSRDNIRDKKISINGIKLKGTRELFESFKCVVFTPDDIDLINEGPEKRRNFIDMCCCQIAPSSLGYIRKYEILLAQRNAALKEIAAGRGDETALDVWNRQMSVIGTRICNMRKRYTARLDKICRELYGKITSGAEVLSITYCSNIFGSDEEIDIHTAASVDKYYERLCRCQKDDIRLGFTTQGANRDDISIKINGLSIRDYGSQGQKKSAALVLKLGQADIYYKNIEEAPVILLDDVMGELDESRQELVFDIVKDMQVFITICNENSVKMLSSGKHFVMEEGRLSERKC